MAEKKKSSEIARTKIDVKTALTLWGRAAGRCEIAINYSIAIQNMEM